MIQVIAKTHELPAGAAVAGYDFRADFGNEYKRVIGYYVLILNNGGIQPAACRVSFANSAKTQVDKIALGHLIVDSSVAIKDRFFKEEPFDIDGYVSTRLDVPAVLTQTLSVQYLFLLSTER